MNNNAVTGFAMLVVIVLNILATLFPYYIAYLLIKPEGFVIPPKNNTDHK